MTHNETRAAWYKEGAIGFGVGILYGVTNVCVGHPLDTIKTKMQAQPGFEKLGMIKSFRKIIRSDSFIGLYRGSIPPLWGSGIFRSVQFATFEASYTFMDNSFGRFEVPYSGGLQLRVIGSGIIASTARSVIECPLEYVKVRRQTGHHTWKFSKLYTGYGITWFRTLGLMTTYFILLDSGRRHLSSQVPNQILGSFFASGIAATLAWWLVWPLEVVKSQVQGEYGEKKSALKRIQSTVKDRGFLSLYRGIAPGSFRSFFANGICHVNIGLRSQNLPPKMIVAESQKENKGFLAPSPVKV